MRLFLHEQLPLQLSYLLLLQNVESLFFVFQVHNYKIVLMQRIQSGCHTSLLATSNHQVSVLYISMEEGFFILYDGKSYFWKVNLQQEKENKINWGALSNNRLITNMTYSFKKQYFFVFADDWNIFILTKQFEYLKKFTLELRYVSHAIFLDHLQAFLSVSKDDITLYHVDFVKETKSAIGFNKTAFRVQITQTKRLKETLPWNKYFTFEYNYKNPRNSYCLIYNQHSCLLYGLEEMEHKLTQKDFIKSENVITTAQYSKHYNYLAIGHQFGQITLWRVAQTNQATHPTHTFTGHKRPVTSLTIQKGYMLFSCSFDATIRIWNLDTFTSMFSYPIGLQQFQQAIFIDHNFLYLQQDSQVYFGVITNIIEHLHFHNSSVKSYDKERLILHRNTQGDQLERVQIALVNNIILSVNSLETEDHIPNDPQKQYVNIFFAPPISQSIVSIHASPYEQNKYFMYFESGEFCQWFIKDGKTQISSIHSFKELVNTQGYPAMQQISIVKILDILPCFFDVETKLWDADISKAKALFNVDDLYGLANLSGEAYTQMKMKMKLLALGTYSQQTKGCKKGTVLFISLNQFNTIFTRISLHKEEIIELGVLVVNEVRLLVSFSVDGLCKFVSFHSGKPDVIRSLTLKQNIGLHFHQHWLALVNGNSLQIFKVDEQNKIKCQMASALNDHDSAILGVDIERTKNLILTNSLFTLKIYDMQRRCLITIQMHLQMDLACFGNSYGDILMSIDGELAITHRLNYQESTEEITGPIIAIEDYFNEEKLKQKDQRDIRQKLRLLTAMTKSVSSPKKDSSQLTNKSVMEDPVTNTHKSAQTRSVPPPPPPPARKQSIKQIVEPEPIQLPTLQKKVILTALPKVPVDNKSKIHQYIMERKAKGPVKNRREWTMDKIILKNLTQQQM